MRDQIVGDVVRRAVGRCKGAGEVEKGVRRSVVLEVADVYTGASKALGVVARVVPERIVTRAENERGRQPREVGAGQLGFQAPVNPARDSLVEDGQADLVPHQHMRHEVVERLARISERSAGEAERIGQRADGMAVGPSLLFQDPSEAS